MERAKPISEMKIKNDFLINNSDNKMSEKTLHDQLEEMSNFVSDSESEVDSDEIDSAIEDICDMCDEPLIGHGVIEYDELPKVTQKTLGKKSGIFYCCCDCMDYFEEKLEEEAREKQKKKEMIESIPGLD